MQNLISLHLSEGDLAEIDTALATLRRIFGSFVALQPEDRVELRKMGPRSRDFCERVLSLLENNPQIVPPSLGLAQALADRMALDQLRPRLQLLRQLSERGDDTEMALGSDMMQVALEGYRLLAVSGKSEALKGARRALSTRFARTTTRPDEPPAGASE